MAGTSKKTIEDTFEAKLKPLRDRLGEAEETVRVVRGQIVVLEEAQADLLKTPEDG